MTLPKSYTIESKIIKQEKLNNGEKVYDAGLGENPLPLNNEYKKILEKNIKSNRYSGVDNDELKNYVWGEKIITGNGLKELINCLQLSFSLTYDDYCIIYIIPVWGTYIEQSELYGLNYTTIEVDKNKLKIDINKLDNKLSNIKENKKMIVFNNPCNPTGKIYTDNEVKNISKVLLKHDCIVLCDDIYSDIILKEDYGDIKKYIPKMCIHGNSLSKSFGCAGWRYGWLGFPKELNELYENSKKIAISTYTCPSSFYHNSVIEMLKILDTSYLINILKECSDIVYNKINKYIKTYKCEGAWYMWLNFESYKNKFKKININNSLDLSKYLGEQINLIVVPGKAFGSDELSVRYSMIDIEFKNNQYNFDKIIEGLDKLIKLLQLL